MTKAEEKLLELLMEKVEALEDTVEELKASNGGTVVHNHYHTHYHPRPGYYWNNWPYGYGGTFWNTAGGSSGLPKGGGATYTINTSGASSSVGGGASGLVASNTASSKDFSSLNLSDIESAAEYQVIGTARY